MKEIFGDRNITIHREMTKKFEEILNFLLQKLYRTNIIKHHSVKYDSEKGGQKVCHT